MQSGLTAQGSVQTSCRNALESAKRPAFSVSSAVQITAEVYLQCASLSAALQCGREGEPGGTAAGGRLGGAAKEVAPPAAGWALRHHRMHLLQVSSRSIAAGAEETGIGRLNCMEHGL